MVALLIILPLSLHISDADAALTSTWGTNLQPVKASSERDIDPCDLLPPGGEIPSQSDTSCVAQYSSDLGEKIVQIQLIISNADTATLCDRLKEPSDFHVFMNDVDIGDCGIQAEIRYKGEPAPGYTGWEIIFYYEGFNVRVATSQDHPANKNWIYNTAEAIEKAIQDSLGATTSPVPSEDQPSDKHEGERDSEGESAQKPAVTETSSDSRTDLPEWVKNGQAYIDYDWTVYHVPEWLEWIKPERDTFQRGFVKPWDKGGEIWVYSRSFDKWIGPIRSSTRLYTGDIVATGPDTSARVYFANEEGQQDAISVGSETFLEVPFGEERLEYPNLWSIYTGLVKIKRALLREVPETGDSPFIVRTPTVVAGSRGTEFVVSYDPETQRSNIYLISGEVDYFNLAASGPEDAVLTAGEKLTVMENGQEAVSSYDDAELKTLLDANKIEETEPLTPEEIELLLSGDKDGEDKDLSGAENAIIEDSTPDDGDAENESTTVEETGPPLSGFILIFCGVLLCGVSTIAVIAIIYFVLKRSKR